MTGSTRTARRLDPQGHPRPRTAPVSVARDFAHKVIGSVVRAATLNAPVGLVTIHHEGAGAPSDIPRGAHGGYTIWIGATNYLILRSPYTSYATLGFNHRSVDVCFSGNRMNFPVTDNDIRLLAAALAECRTRGWVIDQPQVRDHHSSPGSSTVCSGDKTRDRWSAVVAACTRRPTPVPTPTPPKGTIVDFTHVHAALVTGQPHGFGFFTAEYDAKVALDAIACGGTIHGPSVPDDGTWPFSIGATVRVQVRGTKILATIEAPNWNAPEPLPQAHVWAAQA